MWVVESAMVLRACFGLIYAQVCSSGPRTWIAFHFPLLLVKCWQKKINDSIGFIIVIEGYYHSAPILLSVLLIPQSALFIILRSRVILHRGIVPVKWSIKVPYESNACVPWKQCDKKETFQYFKKERHVMWFSRHIFFYVLR